jgi:hypothetical protein
MHPSVGMRGSYDFALAAPGIGVSARIPVGPVFELAPSADYYFSSGPSAWQLNLDFAVRNRFVEILYAGGGLGIAHRAFEVHGLATVPARTKLGLHFFLGVRMPPSVRWRIRPYTEFGYTVVTHFDAYVGVLVGANWVLGKN